MNQNQRSLKKYFPDSLICPICQNSYDKNDHIPMLICFYQHCICLTCIQNMFEVNADQQEVECPFCKQPIDQNYVDKFRLVQELVEASQGLNKYEKQMKEYVGILETENQKLKEELQRQKQSGRSHKKAVEHLTKQLEQKQSEQQEFIDKRRVKTNSSQRVSKKMKKQKSMYLNEKKSSKKYKENEQINRKFPCSSKYISVQDSSKKKTDISFLLQESVESQEPSFLRPKSFQKSSITQTKNKKKLPYMITNPFCIKIDHLKLIARHGIKNIIDFRSIYGKILVTYNFSTLKQLNISNASLVDDHLLLLNQENINLFPALEVLNLSKNRFTMLPMFTYKLKIIRSINANNNFISKLSVHITELDHLREIDLWKNHFAKIPLILLNMKKLEKVDLSNNKIQKINRQILEDSKVKIDLFGNPIKQIYKSTFEQNYKNELVKLLKKNTSRSKAK